MPLARASTLLPALAASVALATPAPADAATPLERRAERLVKRTIRSDLPSGRSASCQVRARRRLACAYSGSRRLSPHRTNVCSGRYRVRLTLRGLRVRHRGRRHCRLRVEAVDPWLGFNDNAIRAELLSAEEDARLTEGVGAGLHRLTFDWRYAEPERNRYVLGPYDRIYDAMLEHGIRPLLVLMFAPRWTWDPLTLCVDDCRYPPARSELAEWREIAGLLATRYPRAAGIEVWNEPNDRRFWDGGLDAERYAELLREAHGAVKEANPAMRVSTAGFSDPPPTYGIAMRDYLPAVLEAGAAQSFDALAFHVYPRGVSLGGLEPTLQVVRDIRDRYRPDRPPLWITEAGFTTTGPAPPSLSEADQAAALVALHRTIREQRDVQALAVHTLLDPPEDPFSSDAGYGIIRADRSKKPAYCALAREVDTGFECP